MCEHGCRPADRTISRRQALGLGAAIVAAAAITDLRPAAAHPGGARPRPAAPTSGLRPGQTTVVDALRPDVRPRAEWAGDRGVRGELTPEDDVRFLLVHHTASTNDYGPDQVAQQLQGFYDFHTGAAKGWPDVAYNFFIDRYGGVWEGRQGSLDGPVRGSATGGSQGFALLCSLIGDFTTEPMTAEQEASLVATLAWLGERYQVDTTPGTEVTFVSRGSNRWPEGTEVATSTIAGHRDMSLTSCPGDTVYRLLDTEIPTAVTDRRLAAAELVVEEATDDGAGSGDDLGGDSEGNDPGAGTGDGSSDGATPTTDDAGAEPTARPTSTDTTATTATTDPTALPGDGASVTESDDGSPGTAILAGGGAAALAAGAAVAFRVAGRDDLNRGS